MFVMVLVRKLLGLLGRVQFQVVLKYTVSNVGNFVILYRLILSSQVSIAINLERV